MKKLFIGLLISAWAASFIPSQAYEDPETGTFITRDPAGMIDGPNEYTYVKQNPWTSFDPEGLATVEDYNKDKVKRGEHEKATIQQYRKDHPDAPKDIKQDKKAQALIKDDETAIAKDDKAISKIEASAKFLKEKADANTALNGPNSFSASINKLAGNLDDVKNKDLMLAPRLEMAGDIITAFTPMGEEKAALKAAADEANIVFKTGHVTQHLKDLGLSAENVEPAIAAQIKAGTQGASQTGEFMGRVVIDGKTVEYRAFTLPNGKINVGTYYPPKP